MTRYAWLLVDLLCAPERAELLSSDQWTDLISIARAESLIGTLAHRLRDVDVPAGVRAILDDALGQADHNRTTALWEARMAAEACVNLDCPIILLKGTAYAAAGLGPSHGRQIGDCDILVPFDRLDEVEAALIGAGWEWVKPDPYDDEYYRRWMHELPPLIHRERDKMIDVHHTILPRTARPTPQADRMVESARDIGGGLSILAPEDMVLHAVAHLFADGDLAGGLRNLWDIHCLIEEFARADDMFWTELGIRADLHQLMPHLARALRLAHRLYDTPVYKYRAGRTKFSDFAYVRRLLARDGYGRETRALTRLAFYIRSHWLRMPPLMLARHLWTKWRKPKRLQTA